MVGWRIVGERKILSSSLLLQGFLTGLSTYYSATVAVTFKHSLRFLSPYCKHLLISVQKDTVKGTKAYHAGHPPHPSQLEVLLSRDTTKKNLPPPNKNGGVQFEDHWLKQDWTSFWRPRSSGGPGKEGKSVEQGM